MDLKVVLKERKRVDENWEESGSLEFLEWSCALDLTNVSSFFRPIRIGFEVAQSGGKCQSGLFWNGLLRTTEAFSEAEIGLVRKVPRVLSVNLR